MAAALMAGKSSHAFVEGGAGNNAITRTLLTAGWPEKDGIDLNTGAATNQPFMPALVSLPRHFRLLTAERSLLANPELGYIKYVPMTFDTMRVAATRRVSVHTHAAIAIVTAPRAELPRAEGPAPDGQIADVTADSVNDR